MKRLIAFVLIFVTLFAMSACGARTDAAAPAEEPENYLFFGLDDAAENTDVILLASFLPKSGRLTLLQIPRDTYYRDAAEEGKINGYYARLRAGGMSEKEALDATGRMYGDFLGIPLRGVFSLTVSGFSALVDALGGVTLRLPAALTIGGETFPAGECRLSGKEAVAFVRYRRGYAGGDLSRLDAQKRFLAALLSALREQGTLPGGVRILGALREHMTSSLDFPTLMRLYLSSRQGLRRAAVIYITVPGAPVLTDGGVSYYVISRVGAEQVLAPMGQVAAFDPEERLCPEDARFRSVYLEPHPVISGYTEDALPFPTTEEP